MFLSFYLQNDYGQNKVFLHGSHNNTYGKDIFEVNCSKTPSFVDSLKTVLNKLVEALSGQKREQY